MEFAPAKPEFCEALKYFHKLTAEGLLDQEGFSQSQQQYYAKGHDMVIGSFLEFLPFYAVGNENASSQRPVNIRKLSLGGSIILIRIFRLSCSGITGNAAFCGIWRMTPARGGRH